MQSKDVYSVNDQAAGCSVERQHLPDDSRDAGGLWTELKLSENSRVMCIKNLGDGIINGSMGNVHSFDLDKSGAVKAVFVLFDDKASGSLFQDPNRDNAVRLEEHSQEFTHAGRFINRTQFPLIPAWAVTIHKAQGMSLDTAVVNIERGIFAHGQIYVALSRVRKLDGLYIEDGIKFNKWWQPSQSVLNYYLKARAMYGELKERLKLYKVKSYL
jgi:ATP-dependent DNA helicase PIF1